MKPPQKHFITIINHSTLISDAEVEKITQALQIQIERDFCKYWNITAQVTFDAEKKRAKAKGAWILGFFDSSDVAGALGYHDLTSDGLPLGKVFVKDDLDNGDLPSVTASHEILEMLPDYACNKYYRRLYKGLWTKFALECGDPVEADEYGYMIGDVKVSNFVTPAYFSRFKKGPYDFMGLLKKPIPEMLPGGYLAYYQSGEWHQIYANKPNPEKDPKLNRYYYSHLYRKRPTKGSRRSLRMIPIKERILSI